ALELESEYLGWWVNGLSGIEDAVGSAEQARGMVEELRRAHPESRLVPLVPALEPGVIGRFGGEHRRTDLAAPVSADWMWHDPFGDCSYAVDDGLLIRAANGRDYGHLNLSAPRLLQPAPSGDFAVQTVCVPLSGAQPAIGGLLLWQDGENYLVLERG